MDKLERLSRDMNDSMRRFERIEVNMKSLSDTLSGINKNLPLPAQFTRPSRMLRAEFLQWLNNLLLIAMGVFLIIRLGPAGYSLPDAQYDRNVLCGAVEEVLTPAQLDKWECPKAAGD